MYDGQIDFYFYEFLYRDRTTDSPTKTTYPITNSLINSLNGTANFSVESTWGYLDPKTGIHNGMTGHLVRGEVDIGGEFVLQLVHVIVQSKFMNANRYSFVHDTGASSGNGIHLNGCENRG